MERKETRFKGNKRPRNLIYCPKYIRLSRRNARHPGKDGCFPSLKKLVRIKYDALAKGSNSGVVWVVLGAANEERGKMNERRGLIVPTITVERGGE